MSQKDYILTNHAQERMKERGITEEEIEEVIKDPEYSYPGVKEEKNLVKTIKRKKIRVVCKDRPKRKIIITVLLVD
jgi:hypothetical protein